MNTTLNPTNKIIVKLGPLITWATMVTSSGKREGRKGRRKEDVT